jgi:hypothetical protein
MPLTSSAGQRLSHIRLGQAELPGDLRWFDSSLEGGPNRVQLSRRQMNGDHLGPRLDGGLERSLEALVSEYIGSMPVLWLKVDDQPGPNSTRGFVERNAIAMLSICQ